MLGFHSISEASISELILEAVVAGLATINMFHNDKAFKYLGTLGFTGGYNDRLYAFLKDNLGRSGSFTDLQAAYIKANGRLI